MRKRIDENCAKQINQSFFKVIIIVNLKHQLLQTIKREQPAHFGA